MLSSSRRSSVYVCSARPRRTRNFRSLYAYYFMTVVDDDSLLTRSNDKTRRKMFNYDILSVCGSMHILPGKLRDIYTAITTVRGSDGFSQKILLSLVCHCVTSRTEIEIVFFTRIFIDFAVRARVHRIRANTCYIGKNVYNTKVCVLQSTVCIHRVNTIFARSAAVV